MVHVFLHIFLKQKKFFFLFFLFSWLPWPGFVSIRDMGGDVYNIYYIM